MTEIKKVAVLGAGVIGSSWAALFLAAGYDVNVYEPSEQGIKRAKEMIATAWPTLQQIGITQQTTPAEPQFFNSAQQAVKEADFVQENAPERIAIKHQLFAEIESQLQAHTVVASSASGLMVSEMQAGWQNPSRFILAHPFNPPHLIPLVELLGNDKTDNDVLEIAEAFFASCGKITIRVQKEVPAHVANRLQAALWREAISLVSNGVASVEDVDKAVWAGPGLRWAAMGPHQLFHLGAGDGGLAEFCTRYGDSFRRWWDDLGTTELDETTIQTLAQGVADYDQGHSKDAALRDGLITAMLTATKPMRQN